MKIIIFILLILLISCSKNEIKVNDFPVTMIKDKPLVIKNLKYFELPDDVRKFYRYSILKNKYDCFIEEPAPELGGLSPRYPMLVFISYDVSDRCLKKVWDWVACYQLLIKKDEKYIVISDSSELKKIFAPVESPEEAISFACAVTNSYPLYTFNLDKNNKYTRKQIFKTYVNKIGTNYIVHLYQFGYLGCGPHYMYSMTYLVYKNGDVKQLAQEIIYDDTDDHTCGD
jgi:hypothetical protein